MHLSISTTLHMMMSISRSLNMIILSSTMQMKIDYFFLKIDKASYATEYNLSPTRGRVRCSPLGASKPQRNILNIFHLFSLSLPSYATEYNLSPTRGRVRDRHQGRPIHKGTLLQGERNVLITQEAPYKLMKEEQLDMDICIAFNIISFLSSLKMYIPSIFNL